MHIFLRISNRTYINNDAYKCIALHDLLQYLIICDPLSKNPTGLHNYGIEIFAIEMHWVKNTFYINNFTHVLIASQHSEERLKLKYLIYYCIRLFMENKNIFVSFLYHEANMSYVYSLPCGKT